MAVRRRARLEDRRRHRFQRGPAAARRSGRGRAGRGRHASRRVRVFNDPGSRHEKFELLWVDDKGAAAGKPIDVYVPPGESRVVRVPRPHGHCAAPIAPVEGDAHGFDNTLYFADERRDEATVLYVGTDEATIPPACSITSSASSSTLPGEACSIASQLASAALARGIRKIGPPTGRS